MGCFPACFGHLRSIATTKRVQDQSSSPSNEQHESVKALVVEVETESHKEEEIVNPNKIVSQSKDECEEEMNESNEEKTVLDHNHELIEKETGKLEEREDEKEREDQDLLIDEKECGEVELKEANLLQCSPSQEDSSESLFSLSIDSRKHIFTAEIGEREVCSPLKMKKSTSFKCKNGDKENSPLSKDPMIDQSCDKSKPLSDKRRESEIGVETSLSSWLVEIEKSPESEKNYKERVVLGVIDIKEVNNGFPSAASTPNTPCCSADSQPAVGTVGRYWRRRGLSGGRG